VNESQSKNSRGFFTWAPWASWAWGAVLFLVYCGLGSFASSAATLYRGMEDALPLATAWAMRYGSLAFPLFGVVAAGGLIVAGLFSLRLVQWCVLVLAMALIVWIFTILTASHVPMRSVDRHAHPATTPLAGLAILSYSRFSAHAQKS
jgi:hypothetical protein